MIEPDLETWVCGDHTIQNRMWRYYFGSSTQRMEQLAVISLRFSAKTRVQQWLIESINGEVCTWRYQYDSEQEQLQDAVPSLTNPVRFFSRFPLSFHDACVQLRGNDWKEIFYAALHRETGNSTLSSLLLGRKQGLTCIRSSRRPSYCDLGCGTSQSSGR